VHGYRFAFRDLRRLDERLEAHLDALLIAGAIARTILDRLVEEKEPGALFVQTVLSLVAGDLTVRERIVETVLGSHRDRLEVDEALAWTPYRHVADPLRDLLASTDPQLRRTALVALTSHRIACNRASEWMDDLDRNLACEAVRHVATLRIPADVFPGRRSQSDDRRYWTAWAGVILGLKPALREFTAFAMDAAEHRSEEEKLCLRSEAQKLCLIALSVEQAHDLLRDITTAPEQMRQRIVGSALIGDPRYLPWLATHMRVPALARAAGESFCAIAGVDLVHAGLDGKPLVESDSNDDAASPVAADPDEELLWPDASKALEWWEEHRSEFREGERYLCGQPVSVENCLRILRAGYQRHRSLAAQHLGLARPDFPLYEVTAPAWRQQAELDKIEAVPHDRRRA
jgi:uncharacterized protein (TIGR02270 family)